MAEGTVKVAVRVRPPFPEEEQDRNLDGIIRVTPEAGQVVVVDDYGFTYDYAFDTATTQEEIYDKCVADVISKVTAGYNCSVLMYGQTGSGKTYTMGTDYRASGGNGTSPGIIPRALNDLFESILDAEACNWSVEVSFLEIYNESVYDLLTDRKSREPIQIREHGKVVMLPGLVRREVKTPAEALQCLEQGCCTRSTGATLVNSCSSRSHAIFTVHLKCLLEGMLFMSKLQLVDLAGSETIKNTQSVGARRKEGVNINLGLLALGNVINALCSHHGKTPHIPYRDSCLTRLLAESLNGTSHTVMIACISPTASNCMETLKTLRYADRARQIKTKPVINRSNKENLWSRGTPAPTPARWRYTSQTSLKTPRDALTGRQQSCKMASTPDESNASFCSTTSTMSLLSKMSSISPVAQQTFPLTPLVERVCQRLEQSTFSNLMKKMESFMVQPEKNCGEDDPALMPLQFGDRTVRARKRKTAKDLLDVSDELEKPALKIFKAPAADGAVRRRRTTMVLQRETLRSSGGSDKENNLSKSDEEGTTMIEMDLTLIERTPPQQPASPPQSVVATRTRRRTTMLGQSERVQELGEARRTRTSVSRDPDCNNGTLTVPAARESACPKQERAADVPQSAIAQRTRRRTTVFAQPQRAQEPAFPRGLRNRRSMFCGPDRSQPCKAPSQKLAGVSVEEIQRKHLGDSLKLLQTGSEKCLQTFACVGPKTAKMLALHRELKGNFKSFSDIKNVQGLSKNFYEKFMSSNILTA